MGYSDIVGTKDVAERLDVQIQTVHTWRQRMRLNFPAPQFHISGSPGWEWQTVKNWAERTGRLAIESSSLFDQVQSPTPTPEGAESQMVPTNIRYQVLAASGGRCALCGATSKERRIEVDHVVPRSKGGSNDIDNLQALCDKCNQGKSNKDDQKF